MPFFPASIEVMGFLFFLCFFFVPYSVAIEQVWPWFDDLRRMPQFTHGRLSLYHCLLFPCYVALVDDPKLNLTVKLGLGLYSQEKCSKFSVLFTYILYRKVKEGNGISSVSHE